MKPAAKILLAATSALLINVDALAAAYTFATPNQALPASLGNGLTGQLWTNVNPNTDTLAQAQAIIGGVATANFRATTIDYPVGAAGYLGLRDLRRRPRPHRPGHARQHQRAHRRRAQHRDALCRLLRRAERR
jgi:hypothetical protein